MASPTNGNWHFAAFLSVGGIATIVMFLLNFTLSKVWAFKER